MSCTPNRPMLLACVALVASVTACSSSGKSTNSSPAPGASSTAAATGSSSSGSTSPTSAGVAVPYDGPEKNLKTIAVPTIKPGTECSIGYQNIFAGAPGLKAEQDAAEAEAKRLGCSFRAVDDMANQTTQVNNMNLLIVKKVNAIIVFPVVTNSLTPSLNKAKAAGIFVIGQSTPVSADAAPVPGYSTNALHMSDTEAYLRVKSVAEAAPGADYALVGLAVPVELLKYYTARTKYWADRFGLHFVGQIDAATDSPPGWAAAASAVIAKYPKVKVLFAYGDNAAVGAAAVMKASNKKGVLISGGDGDSQAVAGIKSGEIFNSPQPDFLLAGKLLVDAAYNEITKQNLPMPTSFGVPVILIDKKNADTVPPIG